MNISHLISFKINIPMLKFNKRIKFMTMSLLDNNSCENTSWNYSLKNCLVKFFMFINDVTDY